MAERECQKRNNTNGEQRLLLSSTANQSTSAELCRCKCKAEGEIGRQQPSWIQTNMQAVVVVTKSQPTTKSTSAELYKCQRKAEGKIGSLKPARIQTMTAS
jgi:hypothetical protein